jgi:hypothetical protein
MPGAQRAKKEDKDKDMDQTTSTATPSLHHSDDTQQQQQQHQHQVMDDAEVVASVQEALRDSDREREASNAVSNAVSSAASVHTLAVHKLVFDFLVTENYTEAASAFVKDASTRVDPKSFESEQGNASENLAAVYSSYVYERNARLADLDGKKKSKKGDEEDSKDESNCAKKKRKRASGQKTVDGEGMLVMKEESQKQYTFGWKRYTEYCQIHNLNVMIGDKASPATQILEFARYLMQNPGKTVKSAVANSYVSAVGKKLLEANVITAMRDIRTPELKELFAEAGRAAAAAAAAAAVNNTSSSSNSSSNTSNTTTIATSSTVAPVAIAIASTNGVDSDAQDKKKKRV